MVVYNFLTLLLTNNFTLVTIELGRIEKSVVKYKYAFKIYSTIAKKE